MHMDDALGFAGRAGGVENVERVFTIHRFGSGCGAMGGQQFVKVHFMWAQLGLGPTLEPDDMAQAQIFHGLIDNAAQINALATPVANIAGNHHLRAGIQNAIPQRPNPHPGIDHRVDGTNARTGQHRNHAFQRQRHVDDDPVALVHAQRFQTGGKAGDQLAQFIVGNFAFAAVFPDPDQRQLGAVGAISVAIQRVEGDVCLPADKPAMVGVLPLHHLLPGLRPGETLRPFAPKTSGVSNAARIFSGKIAQVGLGDQLVGRVKALAIL